MTTARGSTILWKILLIFVCLRPFLSEYAFLTAGKWYIFFLIFFSIIFLIPDLKQILFPLHLNLWPFVFLIIISFSIVLTGCTAWSLTELYFFIPNILIFYISSKIKPGQQRQLLMGVFFTAGIICIYAIYQYFIGLRHTLEYLSPAQQNGYIGRLLINKRVFATFISPNIFASYIAMMLFLTTGLLRSGHGRKRLIFWAGIIVMAASLLYTKSLGGILTFVVTFLLFARYLFASSAFIRKIGAWRVSLIIISIACIFILIYKFLLWGRIPQFLDLYDPNNSIVQRFYYWRTSMDMIKDFLFTGIGWRKFGALYYFYKPSLANISHYSHNVFLQILVETGPFGLISFLLIVFTFLHNGLIVLRKSAEGAALKAGLFFAGCAFLIHNIIDLSFYFGQVAYFWWMIAGLFSNFRLSYSDNEGR